MPGVLPTDYRPYKLIAFSNVQFLDAEFIESALLQPGEDQNDRRQYAGLCAGVSIEGRNFFSKRTLFQHSFDGRLRITAILAGHEYWEPGDPESANSSLQCLQPFGRVLPQQVCAFDWWHLQSDRREILQSRICQRNRARAAVIRLRWSVAEFLTSAGTGVK